MKTLCLVEINIRGDKKELTENLNNLQMKFVHIRVAP